MKLVFSCEHGGNEIPKTYNKFFKNASTSLNSHRGIDFGALDLFNYCKSISDFSESNTVSRLLIELNRSKHHPALFSEFSKSLNSEEKSKLIMEIYDAYRNKVENQISKILGKGEKVLHISFHSFTPILKSKIRNADIGLLYDPSRNLEKVISFKLKENLKLELPEFKIRFNYPYLGTADGFTTYLRKQFPENYSGIELEVNQRFVENGNEFPLRLKSAIFESLSKLKIAYS